MFCLNMSELNHFEPASNLTTPEGNNIVLQSLEHLQESSEPKRKRRKAQVAPELKLAAEVLADEDLPTAEELPIAEDLPTASAALVATELVSAEPEVKPAAAVPQAQVERAHPETSLRAQNLLQQLITAVQSQEAVVTTAAPVRTSAESQVVAPVLEEGPELSAAELERYNRMLLKVGDPCPACGHGTLVLRQSGKVAFLGCSCFPRCKLRYFTRTVSPVHTLKLLTSLCPQCGAPLAVKKGRYGLFIGCSDYPNCTYSPKEAAEENAVECPQCHQGVLRQRRSSSGKIFYGCECYPQCDFKLMGAPYVKTCPECGFPLRFKKKVKAGIALVCGNPKCPTRKKRKYDLLQD